MSMTAPGVAWHRSRYFYRHLDVARAARLTLFSGLTGRTELRVFLAIYLFTLVLQAITTGAFLEQGTTALVVLSAIHAGAVAALFWTLLASGLVSTQIVEDGTLSSLIVSTPS